jgi:hypothetical protein
VNTDAIDERPYVVDTRLPWTERMLVNSQADSLLGRSPRTRATETTATTR